MSRDFETVDLTSSFYQIDYSNYLMSDTIIEINDSLTSNSPRRRETNNRNRRRRRRTTNASLSDNSPLVNGTEIEINNTEAQLIPGKKESPRKRRRDGRPADSLTPDKVNDNPEETSEISPKKARKSALECPICWDDMLNKPLASTKCGHVFCKKCLKKSLKTMKSCPKCRQSLTGNKAFHNLYLS